MRVPTVGRKSDTLLNEREGTPWRYVCSVCGSSAVYARSGNTLKGVRGDHGGEYYCGGCRSSLDMVYDKKSGVEADP